MQRLVAEDPANLAWQHELAVTYDELGDVLQAQGRLAEALARYSASRVIASGSPPPIEAMPASTVTWR